VPRIGAVIEHPVVTRVVSILFSLCTGIDDAELRRSGNEKHWGFIYGTLTVGVNEVNESWYPGQVDDFVVFLEVAWGFFPTSSIR
jgi:hypothetical protein